MGRQHVLVIPYPAQGHVMPLMDLSHNLVDHGFTVTFVNTEGIHKRVITALASKGHYEEFIHLVSISDGVEGVDPRKLHPAQRIELMANGMPVHLEELIKKINDSTTGDNGIACVIADYNVGWALEVAEKMSIPKAAFCPSSSLLIAVNLHIPKFIEDGIITEDGNLIKNQVVQLSPAMPAMNAADLCNWLWMGDGSYQKAIYNMTIKNNLAVQLADYLICNSFYELEPSAFSLVPNLKPIGPLFASSRLGHFLSEDSTCLSWLDQQPTSSVIYVAFGSTSVLNKQQFHELALGLELSGQPFLWVVRPGLTNEVTSVYPDGFEARVGSRGQMIAWAPQIEVLAHPSVGCFLTHCGWNSTMEGLSHGVPLVCWPYFGDQIANKNFICDVWKIGVGLTTGPNGLISREEIKEKVTGLLGDERIKASALKLKEMAMGNVNIGGGSLKNLEDFVEAIKQM